MTPDSFRMSLGEEFYLRNPQDTELGRRIVETSLAMIVKDGFIPFSIKKLAVSIKTTEASVYRYFSNKECILLYCIGMFWAETEFRIKFQTNNMNNPKDRLSAIIDILTDEHGAAEQEFETSHFTLLRNLACLNNSLIFILMEVQKQHQITKAALMPIIKSVYGSINDSVSQLVSDKSKAFMLTETIISFCLNSQKKLQVMEPEKSEDQIKKRIKKYLLGLLK